MAEAYALAVTLNHEFTDRVGGQQFLGFTAADVDPVQRCTPLLLNRTQQRPGIGRPLHGVHPVVDPFAQDAGRFPVAVVDGQPETIGFIPGSGLGAVGYPAPVRRIERVAIEGLVLGGDVDHGVAAVQSQQEQIAVGGHFGTGVGVDDHAEFPTVRSRIVTDPVAVIVGRIIILARRQHGQFTRFQVAGKQVTVLEFAVGVPVAVEQRIGEMGLDRPRSQFFGLFFVAGRIGSEFRVNRSAEDDGPTVGQQQRAGDPGGKRSELSGLAAIPGQCVQLG